MFWYGKDTKVNSPCHLVLKEKKQQDEKAANGNGWVEVGPNNKTSNLQVVSKRMRIKFRGIIRDILVTMNE